MVDGAGTPTDIFIAKLDADGGYLWSRQFGDSGFDFLHSLVLDDANHVVISGAFVGAVDFGGGELYSGQVDHSDVFVAKYDLDSNHVWSRRFGGNNSDIGFEVAVDSAGNVILTGGFYTTTDFGQAIW